jgi:glucose dehydrogenase
MKLILLGGVLAAVVLSAAGLAFLFKDRIKGYLQNSPSGSYMLDKYRGATSPDWDQSAISYSIFEPATWRPVEDPAMRSLLPETKTIPGLNAREIAQLYHAKPFSGSGWTRSGADLYTTKYSESAQINRGNVSDLVKAWTYKSGDARWQGNVETNPIVVGNTLYATTPSQFLVAINAETGKERWRLALQTPARRGLVWWLGNKSYRPRLFVPSTDGVFAVDPANGRIVKSFGHNGSVGSAAVLVAPAVDDGRLLIATNAPSVEAYDPGTGKHLWSRSLIGPAPASDPPSGRTRVKLSAVRPWAGFSVDSDRSTLYVATGNPDPHLYGANRPGNNAFSCSVVAIDTRTGALKWDFQEVAHDLWDFDVPSPPILVTVRRYGLPVDAVAAVTKIGNTLLLDRDTGRPLFDYRLRRAPTSRVPGEVTAPYQPDAELPEPFMRQEFSPADITDIDPHSRATVERKLRNAEFGFFRPPAVHGVVATFGLHGGAEWPGGAVDPSTGILYVATNRYPWVLRLFYNDRLANPIRSRDRAGDRLYQSRCASCHGTDRKGKYEDETVGDGSSPSLVGITADRDLTSEDWYEKSHEGIPGLKPVNSAELATVGRYLANADRISDERRSLEIEDAWQLVLDDTGRPGSKPPWGLINAIDLNTGLKLWSKPFGEYADLKARGVPPTGQPNFGGLIVTRGGLIFATGTVDRKVRALNSTSGEELWSYDLPAAGSAPPVTYEIDGTQYLAVVASGGIYVATNRVHSDEIVAFRLGPSRTGAKKAP